MRRHVLVSRDTIFHLINAHAFRNSALARKCAPAHACYGAAAAAVPDQLAHVSDDETRVILGGLDCLYEIECTARGVAFLTDDPVGEDAEVLTFFPKEEDGAGGGGQVSRGENWNMRIGGRGRKGDAGQVDRGEEAGFHQLADAG